PQKDNVITKDLGSITLFLPGAFSKASGGGVAINTLVNSSKEAGFVESFKAAQLDPSLATSLRPAGTAYDLVTYLSGKFKTAFPKGKPGAEADAAKPAEEKKEGEEKKEETAKPTHLTEGTTEGNVFLI